MKAGAMPILLSQLASRLPEKFQTERLIIRAPRPGDGRAVNDAIRESIDNLRPWMSWARVVPSVAESESFARESSIRYRSREELAMLLFRKSDGWFVGASGLHTIAWDVPRMEIGYWVRTSLQGQGYITEAVNGIAAFAFTILKAVRLEIRCDANNTRSAAVAERAGFTLEARMRWQSRTPSGELRDTLVYAMFSDGIPEAITKAARHLHPE